MGSLRGDSSGLSSTGHLGLLSVITTERSAHLPTGGAGRYPELQTLVLKMPRGYKATQQQEFQARGQRSCLLGLRL